MTLFFGEREITPAIITQGGGGEQIEATNNTGSNISEGDKVWIEPSGNDYNLINLHYAYSNFTIIGSPTVNTSTGVVSGFSSSNYLTLPQSFNPADKTWEVRLKFTTSNNVNSTQGIFQSIIDYTESGQRGIILLIVNGKLRFGISTNGSSWLFITDSSFNLATNTTYWVKFGWTGTEYYLEYSTGGINYTRDITENSSIPAYSLSNYTVLGIYSWSIKEGFLGTLDLSESYIKVNNSTWWNPRVISITEDAFSGFAKENITAGSTGLVNIGAVIEPTGSITITTNGTHDVADYAEAVVNVASGGNLITATNNTGAAVNTGDKVWIEPSGNNYNLINFRSALYNNFAVVGSPTINTSTGVVTNFSSSSFLRLQQAFNPGNSSWEVGLKIKVNDTSNYKGIFHSFKTLNYDPGSFGIAFLISNGYFQIDISANGTDWFFYQNSSFLVQTNTTYWIKIGWTGTEYYLDYSTDGTNYTRDISYSSTTPVYSLNNYTNLGAYNAYTPFPFSGDVYLSDCYITVNDLIWWDPRGIGITENTLTGFATENITSGSSGTIRTVL